MPVIYPSHISGGSSDDPPGGQVLERGPFGAFAVAIDFIARRVYEDKAGDARDERGNNASKNERR